MGTIYKFLHSVGLLQNGMRLSLKNLHMRPILLLRYKLVSLASDYLRDNMARPEMRVQRGRLPAPSSTRLTHSYR